jgi:SAM-dependent methyltransferase
MKPLAPRFGEIHGVDVSDEMVRLARERLRGIPHAHVHATNGAELPQFADSSFDLVYSYAVFQHIPSRDVVIRYLEEIHRVLKRDGIARLQFNGLPQTAPLYDTWAGVRFNPEELAAFTGERGFQVLAMEGAGTQYMWTTWRKRDAGWRERLNPEAARGTARIHRITNAHSSEPVAPNRGRFASVSIWVERLPDAVDLFDLEILVGGALGRCTYIGPVDTSGLQQVNVLLPDSGATGLLPVELRWLGEPLCEGARLRVIPAGPQVPRIISVTDGVNLLAANRVETGSLKIAMEEVADPRDFSASIAGQLIAGYDVFCTDPLPPRYEINFRVPKATPAGRHTLEMRLGRRRFPSVQIEVVS